MTPEKDGMTFRQYLAACCASVFSPLSRLLPKAAVRSAGFSGWLAPLLAAVPLLLLVRSMHRLLTVDGRSCGLGEALELRTGKIPGKLLTVLLGIWLTVYGGFLLRSGAERLLSTVYHAGSLAFFLPALLLLSTVVAMGPLRAAGRCASVLLLMFAGALTLVLLLAIPAVKPVNLWPPELVQGPGLALSALPVMDALSPWVYFSFLRGSVKADDRARQRGCRGMLAMLGLALLFLVSTIGVLGAELCERLQYPFFTMTKNLTLLNVMARFDALVVVLWMMTDHVCISMILVSASEAFRGLLGKGSRRDYVLPLAALMIICAFLLSENAFSFAIISEKVVPGLNLCLAFGVLPALSLVPAKKISEK